MTHRILVLRLSSLGDVVLTTPVYRNLKAHWPAAHISVMVKPQFAAALARNPHIDEVLPYRGHREALALIRGKPFTHLLDLHANARTFWLRHLAGIPNVSVYRKDALARRLFVYFRLSSPSLVRHTLDRYLEALSAWGVPVRSRELSLGDYASPAAPVQAQGSRVLLAQTSFLGDALLTVPLARRIKEALPGCRLSVLTRPQTADVFRRSPWVDEVIEDDKRVRHAGLRGFFSLARSLQGRFDVAISAHRSLRTALLLRLAKVPLRIGFSSSAGWFLYHRTVYFSWGMPDLERNLALLLPLMPDLKTEDRDSLYLSAQREGSGVSESVSRRLKDAGIGEGAVLVGLHPGSAWPTKRWPAQSYARLASSLVREAGARVVLVGGPEDAGLARGITASAGEGVLDWTGKTTLPELMELVGRLSLFVTNDSGPMHVAAACGVPVIGIFGPTTRELGFFPYGRGHQVVEKELSCRPCGLHGSKTCPQGHFLCMRLIRVEEVFAHARRMLLSKRGPQRNNRADEVAAA
ncbi:MAG: lipopolysaccharide heptosyltransferase II [Elusimicrobiota bacterium]|jgi:heptosyltransferase-2